MKKKKIHTRKLAHFLLNQGNVLIKICSESGSRNHICYIFDFSDSCKDKLINDIKIYNDILSSKENMKIVNVENPILSVLEHMLFTRGSQITPMIISLSNNELYYNDLANKRKE